MTCSKLENRRFLVVLFKRIIVLTPQQATKTQTFILLESGTDINSCSGNKVYEFTVCKGM